MSLHLEPEDGGWVVESPVTKTFENEDGVQVTKRVGTARFWCRTEARAIEHVAELPSKRTYRRVLYADMPEKARLEMQTSRQQENRAS